MATIEGGHFNHPLGSIATSLHERKANRPKLVLLSAKTAEGQEIASLLRAYGHEVTVSESTYHKYSKTDPTLIVSCTRNGKRHYGPLRGIKEVKHWLEGDKTIPIKKRQKR